MWYEAHLMSLWVPFLWDGVGIGKLLLHLSKPRPREVRDLPRVVQPQEWKECGAVTYYPSTLEG